MGNDEDADILAPCWQQLIALLSESSYHYGLQVHKSSAKRDVF